MDAAAATYDAVIVGGGHNALVAAAYLSRAGHRVIVLERLDHVGGAAVSEQPWSGVEAAVSRYSYLVSLLPSRIIDDLGLRVALRRRRYSSYTPDPEHPSRGVLIDTEDAAVTAASFRRTLGSSSQEATRLAAFTARLAPVARTVFPTMTDPLLDAQTMRRRLDDDRLWHDVVLTPLSEMLRASLDSDLARGIALTDGLIGTFARSDDVSLRQNRCFLYHVIGGGTGDWDVPVGGMGRVSSELERAARNAGAELRTGAAVTAVSPDGEVTIADQPPVHGRLVLSGVGSAVLARLLRAGGADIVEPVAPEGAQLKVNMLLRRLPRLQDAAVSAEAAFAGTFHINESMSQLDGAYDVAAAGGIPAPLPAEVYCHSLTDPTILGPTLRASGAQTLTLFGLHVPHRLVVQGIRRETLLAAAEQSLDAVLGEPLRPLLYETPQGDACIEARTTADLEESLGMVGGDIFHGSLSWPWSDDGDVLDTAARRWGVEGPLPGILLCGSSARRGGAVSGVGGHNAAMAALEMLD